MGSLLLCGPTRVDISCLHGVDAHQASSSEKGGGLGALTTLARAVEQEERREELSLQLTKETKALDVLAAEVKG